MTFNRIHARTECVPTRTADINVRSDARPSRTVMRSAREIFSSMHTFLKHDGSVLTFVHKEERPVCTGVPFTPAFLSNARSVAVFVCMIASSTPSDGTNALTFFIPFHTSTGSLRNTIGLHVPEQLDEN